MKVPAGSAGGRASYAVPVAVTSTDSGWKVSGTITIHNPASMDASITDVSGAMGVGRARPAEMPRPPSGTGLSSSDLASLANMSQELTGPHAPYMLIVYVLIDKIKSGELKPGDRVPSVTELVGTYNVSHSTARRALAKLKDMGLTDTVPGYATFVRLPDQDEPS